MSMSSQVFKFSNIRSRFTLSKLGKSLMGRGNENVLAEYSPLSLLVGCLYPDSPGVLVPLTGPASNDPVNTGPPLPPVLLRPPAAAARGLGGSRKQGFGIFTNQPFDMF